MNLEIENYRETVTYFIDKSHIELLRNIKSNQSCPNLT
jgi:hypothetical protein